MGGEGRLWGALTFVCHLWGKACVNGIQGLHIRGWEHILALAGGQWKQIGLWGMGSESVSSISKLFQPLYIYLTTPFIIPL